MKTKFRVLIFIVSFNAENFIHSVLQRIPAEVWDHNLYDVEVLIIDDQSTDNTFHRAQDFIKDHPGLNIRVLYNPENQGYGGNQKLGYRYAIKNRFDIVVLLHGDGQYAPEYLKLVIEPLRLGKADVVLGSRMLDRLQALRGKMPLYKWIGNQILTGIQNFLLRSQLAEFHTGYRAYRVSSLEKIPYEANSNYFDFDTEILIQMIDTRQRIIEVPVPTYYGEEISHVNGLKYAGLILRSTMRSRIVQLGLFFDRRFEYETSINDHYRFKSHFPSSHRLALENTTPGQTILDLGCGPGHMAQALHERGVSVVSVDRKITPMTSDYSTSVVEGNVEDLNFSAFEEDYDQIFLLDIIEHLNDPEGFLERLRTHFGSSQPPRVFITTGNIAFILVRLSLLIGKFNYGKMGILDRDHKRLYTFSSMKRLLEAAGYKIIAVKGIPAPFPLAIGNRFLANILLAINQFLIRLSKGLFSYQMAFIASPLASLDYLLEEANKTSKEKSGNHQKTSLTS